MSRHCEEQINHKIKEISLVADQFPGVVIIHDLPDFTVQYMCQAGLEGIQMKMEDLKNMSNQEYHERFFNPEDAQDYVPKIMNLLERNTDDVVTFFQQVRTSRNSDWDWYHSAIRILLRDDSNQPLLTITTAMKFDPQHHITSKVSRLLEENNFLRKHYHRFFKLTDREQQILTLLALGNTSPEISGKLFISTATVETHRKNIKRKLDISTSYEISMYARAFDLI